MRLSVNVECVLVFFVPSQKNTGATKARLTGRWWEFVSRVKGTNKYLKWTPDIKGRNLTPPIAFSWRWLMCGYLNNSFSFTYRKWLAWLLSPEIFIKKIGPKICTFRACGVTGPPGWSWGTYALLNWVWWRGRKCHKFRQKGNFWALVGF